MIEAIAKFWDAAKGWRTLVLSVVLAVVGVLETADWAAIVSPRQVGPTMLVVAVLVAVLRAVTSSPVGRK